jgi:hypothetical protein
MRAKDSRGVHKCKHTVHRFLSVPSTKRAKNMISGRVEFSEDLPSTACSEMSQSPFHYHREVLEALSQLLEVFDSEFGSSSRTRLELKTSNARTRRHAAFSPSQRHGLGELLLLSWRHHGFWFEVNIVPLTLLGTGFAKSDLRRHIIDTLVGVPCLCSAYYY